MPRKTSEDSGVLYVRDAELVADIDAWLAKLNKNPDAPQWTRTTLVRAVFKRALREYGKRGESP